MLSLSPSRSPSASPYLNIFCHHEPQTFPGINLWGSI